MLSLMDLMTFKVIFIDSWSTGLLLKDLGEQSPKREAAE